LTAYKRRAATSNKIRDGIRKPAMHCRLQS
jgi:hypothetical protein